MSVPPIGFRGKGNGPARRRLPLPASALFFLLASLGFIAAAGGPAPRFQPAEMEVYGPDVDGPAIKDHGLKDYVRLSKVLPHSEDKTWRLVCGMPYNCQFQPWIEVEGPAGRTIQFNSSNPLVLYLTPTETVTTAPGRRAYEAKNWVSGEGAIYTIPPGVTVRGVKYRETGYDQTGTDPTYHWSVYELDVYR